MKLLRSAGPFPTVDQVMRQQLCIHMVGTGAISAAVDGSRLRADERPTNQPFSGI